jgi:hypothetical protein
MRDRLESLHYFNGVLRFVQHVRICPKRRSLGVVGRGGRSRDRDFFDLGTPEAITVEGPTCIFGKLR